MVELTGNLAFKFLETRNRARFSVAQSVGEELILSIGGPARQGRGSAMCFTRVNRLRVQDG